MTLYKKAVIFGAMQEHKSRFKAYLIPAENLAAEAARLRPLLRQLQELADLLSPAERVLLFICIYAQSRQPHQWWRRRGKVTTGERGFCFAELPMEFEFLKEMPARHLEEFCTNFDFKKMPASITRSLLAWSEGTARLILKDSPVTPMEMLAVQARGERIVTLDLRAALEGELVDGRRDAFEFLLHDLVHADLFFSDGHGDQVRFFRGMEPVLHEDYFVQALQQNPEFKKDIDYLISDMNSHSEHMQGLLKASLVKHQLFSERKGPSDTLSDEGRQQLERRWSLLNNRIFP